MYAEVLKKSESGKSILVGVKNSKFSIGFDGIGYANIPEGMEEIKKGDQVKDFPMPKGTCQKKNAEGEVLSTKAGEPLTFWVF